MRSRATPREVGGERAKLGLHLPPLRGTGVPASAPPPVTRHQSLTGAPVPGATEVGDPPFSEAHSWAWRSLTRGLQTLEVQSARDFSETAFQLTGYVPMHDFFPPLRKETVDSMRPSKESLAPQRVNHQTGGRKGAYTANYNAVRQVL